MANCVSVMIKMLHLFNFTISCYDRRAWKTSRCACALAGSHFWLVESNLFGDHVSLRLHRDDSAPANGLTGQLLFSLPHANPMEQSPNQIPQNLPILKINTLVKRKYEYYWMSSTHINLCCQRNVIGLPSLKQTQR